MFGGLFSFITSGGSTSAADTKSALDAEPVIISPGLASASLGAKAEDAAPAAVAIDVKEAAAATDAKAIEAATPVVKTAEAATPVVKTAEATVTTPAAATTPAMAAIDVKTAGAATLAAIDVKTAGAATLAATPDVKTAGAATLAATPDVKTAGAATLAATPDVKTAGAATLAATPDVKTSAAVLDVKTSAATPDVKAAEATSAKKCKHCEGKGQITVRKYAMCDACDGAGGLRCTCRIRYAKIAKRYIELGFAEVTLLGTFDEFEKMCVQQEWAGKVYYMTKTHFGDLIDDVIAPHIAKCAGGFRRVCAECEGAGSLDLGMRALRCPACAQ